MTMTKGKKGISNESYASTRRNTLKVAAGTIVGSTLLATSVSGQSTIEIEDWNELNDIRNNINLDHILVSDLDSQTDGYQKYVGEPEKGWEPIGKDFDSAFQGTFDGNNHKISDLIVNRPDASNVGLFGATRGAVKNISVTNSDITGSWNAGALVGYPYENIHNSFAHGTVTGRISGGIAGQSTSGVEIKNCSANANIKNSNTAGGLVGAGGTIIKSSAEGHITGGNSVGGLIGSNSSKVVNSYAKGKITGKHGVGGLVGHSTPSGDVTNSYAISEVKGEDSVGGLVGNNNGGEILESFAACQVVGVDRVGGLVGSIGNQGSVRRSYSVSKTTGENKIGGLVGRNPRGLIEMSFAAGKILLNESEDGGATGGLIGELGSSFGSGDAVIKSSYWDETTTTQSEAVGVIVDNSTVEIGNDVVGYETNKIQGNAASKNMAGFNFGDEGNKVWYTVSAGDNFNLTPSEDSYPILQVIDSEPQLKAIFGVELTNISLDPSEITTSPSEHTLEFDAENVSADRTGDQFEVSFPDDVDLEGYSDVEIDDLSEENPVEQTDNTLSFSVNPSGGGSTRISVRLTVTLSASN